MSEPVSVDPRSRLEALLSAVRPKLHRYCARMTGSAIDGEDVVQEVLLKIMDPALRLETLLNPEAWLFRVAHNAALDFLRRRARENIALSLQSLDTTAEDTIPEDERQQITAASLHTFMRLSTTQRSCVILMDVLGYSLQEVAQIAELSVPAVKAALHRGRERLRLLADEPETRQQLRLSGAERSLLAAYIDRFNARDFEAVRDMLAEEVRLDLVARTRMNGRAEVSTYFSNYSRVHDWRLIGGEIEQHPAILVYAPAAEGNRPSYFMLLEWRDGKVASIRDFRYARYAAESVDFSVC